MWTRPNRLSYPYAHSKLSSNDQTKVPLPRCHPAIEVSDPRDAERLVDGDPVTDAVTERVGDDPGIVGEHPSGAPLRPPTTGLVDPAGVDRLDLSRLVAGGLHGQDNPPLWIHGAGQGGGDRLGYAPIDALTDQPADRNRGGQVEGFDIHR